MRCIAGGGGSGDGGGNFGGIGISVAGWDVGWASRPCVLVCRGGGRRRHFVMSFRRCVSCWLRIVAQPSSILSAAKIFDDADAGEVSSHFRNWNCCWTVVTTRVYFETTRFPILLLRDRTFEGYRWVWWYRYCIVFSPEGRRRPSSSSSSGRTIYYSTSVA